MKYNELELRSFAKEFIDIVMTTYSNEYLSEYQKIGEAEEMIAERLSEIMEGKNESN